MKTKFLTVYDYGTGGVWQYVYAESKKDILDKYPKLEVLDEKPEWFEDRVESIKDLRIYDIDDAPDEVMKGFQSDK